MRFGLTPVFLDDQASFVAEWRQYLSERLTREVVFVQRGSYREIVDLLAGGKLDFAWVCGYPYVRARGSMRLVAVPLYGGKPLYRSYLIVAARDTQSRELADLRGKVFAYSDPDSNSGFLYPQFALIEAGERPQDFFSRTFFTWAHRKVVDAVAAGLAQAGAVDGYVWDTLANQRPELARRTRVLARSPEFGFPPIVARASVSDHDFRAMQRVLVSIGDDERGARLLRNLNLDGFRPGDVSLFETIAAMSRRVNGR